MNYGGELQASPLSPGDLLTLCVKLAPDPDEPKVPPPAAGPTTLDPKDIHDRLLVATSALALEEGLLESLAASICDGHVILTGPPGTAKSTLAILLAEVVKGDQWT